MDVSSTSQHEMGLEIKSKPAAHHLSSLEKLPEPIIHQILLSLHLPTLFSLTLTSRTLSIYTTPIFYHTFAVHFLTSPLSTTTLQLFLQTLTWRPDLAALVKELDIREWAWCPRIEDFEPIKGVEWSGGGSWNDGYKGVRKPGELGIWNGTYGKFGEWGKDAEPSWGDGQESDEDFVVEEEDEENDEESDIETEIDEADIETCREENWGCKHSSGNRHAHWEDLESRLRSDALAMNFNDPQVLFAYWESMNEKEENKLLQMIINRLPNIRVLKMVVPERGAECVQSLLKKDQEDGKEGKEMKILRNLESLYYISSLRIGPKGHRQYDIGVDEITPFLSLPTLKTLHTVTPIYYFDPAESPLNDCSLPQNTSNITTLSFNNASLSPRDGINFVSIPKALQSFTWSQRLECYSPGTCHGPFFKRLGGALGKHKSTLRVLDLDIRIKYCTGLGHVANPMAREVDLEGLYGRNRKRREREDNDGVLIGDLSGFERLEELWIGAGELCGVEGWWRATGLEDRLPRCLKVLMVRVWILVGEDGVSRVENQWLVEDLIGLVGRVKERFRGLEKIGILALDKEKYRRMGPIDDDEEEEVELEEGSAIDGAELFNGLENVCEKAGIHFSVENEVFGTRIPFFVEYIKARKPGLDF